MESNPKTKHERTTAADRPYRTAGLSAFVHILAPRWLLRTLLLASPLLLAAVAMGAFWLGDREGNRAGAMTPATNATISTASEQSYQAKPGPWGVLDCQRSFIELPAEYLGTDWLAAEKPRWFFRGYSAEALTNLFARLGLSEPELRNLADRRHWQVLPAGIYVEPSAATILALSPSARDELYLELGKFEENVMQNQPFHWPLAAEPSLFDEAEVSAQGQELFHKLSYHRGKSLLFSDWATLLRSLAHPADRVNLAKTLSRRSVVFASMRIDQHSNLPALLRYWGRGGLAKDIRPTLEAVAKVPGGGRISIPALLPPAVRATIYTYPLESANDMFNCHWTSFNFFKGTNPAPPATIGYWNRKLKAEYVRISDSPLYGDVLVLTKPGGEIVHSCVFIADEIVYTKNGASVLAPWALMTLSDVIEFYSWDLPAGQELKVTCFRERGT